MVIDTLKIIFGIPLESATTPPEVISDKDVKFYVATRKFNIISVNESNTEKVHASKRVKFIIHGWNEGAMFNDWYGRLTAALLKEGDYNVIAVDWFAPAIKLYPISAQNTFAVGKSLNSQH